MTRRRVTSSSCAQASVQNSLAVIVDGKVNPVSLPLFASSSGAGAWPRA